jgi:hypothetical protein
VILSGTNQKRAIIDKKTLHNLLTGSTMRVRISDYNDESHLDEFTIGGLNVNELRDDCGSKWFGKEEASSSRNSGDEKKMK